MRLIISFVLLLFIFSCQNTTKENVKNSSNSTIDTLALSPEKANAEIICDRVGLDLNGKPNKDIAEENFTYRFCFFQKNDTIFPYQLTINTHIIKLLNNNSTLKADELTKDVFEKYNRKTYAEYASTLKENPEMFDWDSESSIEIDTNFKSVAQLSFSNSNFSGGAHGSVVEYYFLVDKVSGKTLKVKDLVTNTKKLELIAEDFFRKQNKLDPEANLSDQGFWFENGFKLNDNFFIHKGKLNFVFNQYEIAPYSMGMPQVEIPINKIKHLLKVNLD